MVRKVLSLRALFRNASCMFCACFSMEQSFLKEPHGAPARPPRWAKWICHHHTVSEVQPQDRHSYIVTAIWSRKFGRGHAAFGGLFEGVSDLDQPWLAARGSSETDPEWSGLGLK